MTYVFGDIHGCLKSFNFLLERLSPGKGDVVVTLGDYIDRGPASKGVIDRLLKLRDETTLVALRGNHELMMEDARKGPPASSFWLLNGGIETLESYSGRSLANIPQEHWQFLSELKTHHEMDNFLLVHATPPADACIENCDDDDLYWSRFRNPKPRADGKILVCGHTPQDERVPVHHNGNICIDTGCVHEGYLTALTLETGAYLQANEEGTFKNGEIELLVAEAAA